MRQETYSEAVGRRLREVREKLGMTQKDFGQLADVSRAYQIFYENCDRHPTTVYFEKLQKHDIDIAYILTGLKA